MVILFLMAALWLVGCQTGSAPAGTADTETEEYKSLAPQRVDIRGSIVASRYTDGQVVLEVERLSHSPDSRYERAYVLVQPTAQLISTDGRSLGISELRQGQNVAILLRGGGRGTGVGVGIARKLWIEGGF